jgi:hypothetical protein
VNAVLRRSLAPLLLVATAAWACGLTRLAHERIAHTATTANDHDDHLPAHEGDHDRDRGECAACHLLASPLTPWSSAEHPLTPDRPTGASPVADDQPRPRTAAPGLPPARGPPATA